jgi:WD40 repeat protein
LYNNRNKLLHLLYIYQGGIGMLKKLGLFAIVLLCVFSLSIWAQEIDLIAKAPQAKWGTTSGDTLAFGADGRERGTARYEHDGVLEDGKRYKRVLYTHPQWRRNGNIRGVFSNISIPKRGGKLLIAGGLLQGARSSDGARFSVHFNPTTEETQSPQKVRVKRRVPIDRRVGTASGRVLATLDVKYDGKIDQIEADLKDVAGLKGDIILAVQALNTSDADWAVWTMAKLVFGEAKIPIKATLHKTLRGHNNRIYMARFSRDGRLMVTAGGDGLVKLWDVNSGNMVRSFKGHSSHVFSARFSPNNRRVVTAGGKAAKIWDVSTGTQIDMLIGHSEIVHSAEYSPDGGVIVTASEDGTVKLWNAQNGKEIRSIEITKKGWAYDAAFHPNGRSVAIGARGGLAGIWDVSNGRRIRTFSGHRRAISSVAFSPNGKYIATSSIDNTARIWEVSDGRLLQTLHGENVREINFSPDGIYAVTAHGGGVAKIWNVQDGKELLSINHSSPAFRVMSATFSPDGKYIVTAGDDQTAKIWKVIL